MNKARKTASVLVVVGAVFASHLLMADQIHDNKLTSNIKTALAMEQDIPAEDIAVITKGDVVKLSGVVDSSDYLRDAMITAKAKGKIAQLANQHNIGKKYSLHVETTNGVVHIFGRLAKGQDAKQIRDSIMKIDNVKNVKFNV